jgi:hypothetical protein
MKRQEAFGIATELLDLGIDCSVSLAAPSIGVPEVCMVHITGFVDTTLVVQIIAIAAAHDADVQLGDRDFRIADRPAGAPPLRSVA